MEDRLLTTSETAAWLRAPVATLRYWRHAGTGPPSVRLGRRIVYRESDVARWIEAQFEAQSQ
jgi:predicted DNA-binding transcriptional regulator AlpA